MKSSGANVRNARLVVAYDGSSFHGFAPNRDVPTVAGALTEALEKITQVPCISWWPGAPTPACMRARKS